MLQTSPLSPLVRGNAVYITTNDSHIWLISISCLNGLFVQRTKQFNLSVLCKNTVFLSLCNLLLLLQAFCLYTNSHIPELTGTQSFLL